MNAKYFQDLLNEHGLVFRITDERQKFDTYKKSKDIAGILETLTGGYLYDQTGNKVISYQIEFWGDNKDFDDFKQIVDDYFPNDTGDGEFYIYSQPVEFIEFTESGGDKKFVARVSFQVIEVIGGVSGKSSYIKIDNVKIDFKRVLYRQDKTLMPFTAFGVNKEVKVVSEMLTLKLPVSANTKNGELLTMAMDDTYNAKVVVEWKIGGLIKTFDAVVRVGIVEYNNTHEPIMFDITLERALPRETWEISLFHYTNHWEISTDYKPSDITYTEEIDNEQDFLVFLETLDKLDDVGYVVKNVYISEIEWDDLGTEKAFVYLGISDGSHDGEIDVFDDIEPLTWVRDNLDVDDFAVGKKIGLYYEDIDETYLVRVDAVGYSWQKYVYDETRDVNFTNLTDFMNYIESEFAAIDQDGYVVMVKSKFKEWKYVAQAGVRLPLLDDNVRTFTTNNVSGRVDFMVNLPSAATYEVGDLLRNYCAECYSTVRYRYAEVVETEMFWFAKLTVDGWVFYGKVVEGGGYGSPFDLQVIDFAAKHSVETTPRNSGTKTLVSPVSWASAFTCLLVIDEKSQELINDHYDQVGNHYKISFKIGAKTYDYFAMVLTDIERQNTENANQVMQVSFVEGEV